MSGPARLTPRMAIPTDDLGAAPRIVPPAEPKRLSRLDGRLSAGRELPDGGGSMFSVIVTAAKREHVRKI